MPASVIRVSSYSEHGSILMASQEADAEIQQNSVSSPELSRKEEGLSMDAAMSISQADPKNLHMPFSRRVWNTLYELIWPDLILSHLDYASLKTILRSWLMMWSLTIICICERTIPFMGPSSFLANFAAGIEISGSLSVSSAFAHCMGDLLSLTWALMVSVVTLAICWSIRGYPTEPSAIEELRLAGHCLKTIRPNFSNCIEPMMHEGYFLNIKTTVVTVFGMIFSFTSCGLFQSFSRYGTLAWLLNSLFTIIVFTFNNFLPLWKPWYHARNAFVPMAMAFAARFFVSLVVLPHSSNHKTVSSLAIACTKLKATCEKMQATSREFKPSGSDFINKFNFISSETQETFTKYIIQEADMEIVNHLEIWFSHFDKGDLTELRSQVRLIMSALSTFHFFFEDMKDRHASCLSDVDKSIESIPMLKKIKPPQDLISEYNYLPDYFANQLKDVRKETGLYELGQKLKAIKVARKLASPSESLKTKEVLDDLKNAKQSFEERLDFEYFCILERYRDLVLSTCNLLGSVSDWLNISSDVMPWVLGYGRSKHRRKCQERIEALLKTLDAHVLKLREARQQTTPSDTHFALYRYICLHIARRVKTVARWCVYIQSKRSEPALCTPFQKRTESSNTFVQTEDLDCDGYHDNISEALDRTYTSFEPLKGVEVRDPDSSPPRTALHLLGKAIIKFHHWCYDPDFLFCLKRSVLTVATLTPYFCRPTARLAYEHWFLWVAVLTTYTVARQAVDGIYGFVGKFFYTFFGCLVGMVGWYISAGSGHGNPFGYAAVTAFVWAYICFQRQFNKHFAASTSIVYSCTVTLVLGNSWNGGHLSQPGVELGRGFDVAWVRFVTVTIGITISFLGTIFPHAYTAKKAVRTIVGTCIEHLGDLQASISNFGVQRYSRPSIHIVAHSDLVTRAARAIITNLHSADSLRKRLVYEPPLAGIYPTQRYQLLINYVHETTLLYSLIYVFLDEVHDTSKIPGILQRMGWTDPNLSTGVYSLMHMCGRSLIYGKALPSISPANLAEHFVSGPMARTKVDLERSGQDAHERSNVAAITAVALTSQLYERLDGISLLVKELVGEVYDLDISIFDLNEQSL